MAVPGLGRFGPALGFAGRAASGLHEIPQDSPRRLHHRLCHTLGGAPPGETQAVLLPRNVALNAQAAAAGPRNRA